MRIPVIQGIIRRRILVNFRVDAKIMARLLPSPFKPKLHNGYAIAGICLIRLEDVRPKPIKPAIGLSSENAAHRVAVLWPNEGGGLQEGVYIPRRDTDSVLNVVAGGRLFPGEHHHAVFNVQQQDNGFIDFQMKSSDGEVEVRFQGHSTITLPRTSKFSSLAEASSFFENGSHGYSATRKGVQFDGLLLKTEQWRVEPLEIENVFSSYFGNEKNFPKGSVEFDCALIMRNIEHEWHSLPDLHKTPSIAEPALIP